MSQCNVVKTKGLKRFKSTFFLWKAYGGC